MLKYGIVPVRRIGQQMTREIPVPFYVSVVDKRGNPFVNAQIMVGPSGAFGYTDSHGKATLLNVPSGDVEVVAVLAGGMKVTQKGNTRSDMFIELPICAPMPLLTKTEIIVLVGGAAIAGAGFLWKLSPLEAIGELAIGGGIFSAIYRNSCDW
jgi:hypothetical protein